MSLLQFGTYAIWGQGHRGVFYERLRQRVNLSSKVTGGNCSDSTGACIDTIEEQYRLYIRGNGALATAQAVRNSIWAEICTGSARSYFRRRMTEDALLEIYKIKSGKMEETDFRLQFTQCRTISMDVTLELEPLTEAEESDVIAGDLTVEP